MLYFVLGASVHASEAQVNLLRPLCQLAALTMKVLLFTSVSAGLIYITVYNIICFSFTKDSYSLWLMGSLHHLKSWMN